MATVKNRLALQNAHPGIDLARTLERFKGFVRQAGEGEAFKHADIMALLGYKSPRNGAGHPVISSFVQFRLLERNQENEFTFTAWGDEVGKGNTDIELLQKIALAPEMYKRLFAEFGKDLPEDINDWLIRRYRHRNINNADKAIEAARNYLRTLEHVGLAEDASGEHQEQNAQQTLVAPRTSPLVSDDLIEVTFLGTRAVVAKQFFREAIEKTQAQLIEVLK